MVTRLRMALSLFRNGNGWWDRGACLRGDKVGNTELETARLCDRIKRWAKQLPELHGLVPWITTIQSMMSIPHSVSAPMRSAA